MPNSNEQLSKEQVRSRTASTMSSTPEFPQSDTAAAHSGPIVRAIALDAPSNGTATEVIFKATLADVDSVPVTLAKHIDSPAFHASRTGVFHKASIANDESLNAEAELDALGDLKQFLRITEAPLLEHCNICDEAVVTDSFTLRKYCDRLWKHLLKCVVVNADEDQNLAALHFDSKEARSLLSESLHWRPHFRTTSNTEQKDAGMPRGPQTFTHIGICARCYADVGRNIVPLF